MRRKIVFVVLVGAFTLMVGLMAACGGSAPAQTVEPGAPLASSEGEALLQERCTDCHSLARVERAQKTRAGWEQNVARMVGKGARLNEDEQAILVEYLTETYGP
jgi:cbb3-type cytochrome oxidase cytochrome c subunit